MPELLISCGDRADDTGLRASVIHSFNMTLITAAIAPPPPPPQHFSVQSHSKMWLQYLVLTLEGSMCKWIGQYTEKAHSLI